MFLCPEGAATVTAARRLGRAGWIGADDEVVLLNTGAGVIYPDTVPVDAAVVGRDSPYALETIYRPLSELNSLND